MHKYIAHLLLNSQINYFFYSTLLIVQALQIFCLNVEFQGISIFRKIFLLAIFQSATLNILLIMMLLCFITCFCLGYLLFKKTQNQVMIQRQIKFEFIKSTIKFISILLKTALALPLHYCIWNSINNGQDILQFTLGIILIVLYLIFVLPFLILNYWNKIAIKKQLISYPFIINLDSFTYFYLLILAFVSVMTPSFLVALNIIYCVFSCLIIIIHSPINFKKYNASSIIFSVIIAEIFVSIINKILDRAIDGISSAFIYFFSTFCISFLIHQLQFTMLKRNFFRKAANKKNCLDFIKNQNQALFFHMMNFSQYLNRIIIYFIQNADQCFEQEYLSKKIFEQLKMNSQRRQKKQLFSLIKEKILNQILSQYNLAKASLNGQKYISKQMYENQKLYILIIQLVMVEQEDCSILQNLRKSYFFLKQHEKLSNIAHESNSFLTKVEIHMLFQIMEEQLNLLIRKQSQNNSFNLKANEYFNFQFQLETFKRQINKVSNLNLSFWKQIIQKQPDIEKIHGLVQSSHYYSKKVEFLFQKLLSKNKQSSIVVYELINQYSQLILNCQLSSLSNPFNKISSIYKNEALSLEKENASSLKKCFQLTSNTSICVVQTEKSMQQQIVWKNQKFSERFQNQEMQIKIMQDLIPPFFRNCHTGFIDQFLRGQAINYDHKQILIFRNDNKKSWIQSTQIQLQIIPSFKKGLRILILFKDSNYQNKAKNSKNILVDQKLQFIYFSNYLKKQWKISSKGVQQEQVTLKIFNQLQNNSQWKNLLISEKIGLQIKLDLQDSDYIAKLEKLMKDQKGKRYFYFQLKDIMNQPQTQNKFEKAMQSSVKAQSVLKSFMENTIQSLNAQKKSAFSQIKYESKLRQSKNKEVSTIMQDQFKEIIKQKHQSLVNLEHAYKTLTRPATPRKIIIWRFITVVLILCIMGAITSNMIVTVKRSDVYMKDMNIIKHYNQMIQYIARSMITLKQYNYQAFSHNSSSKLPFYKIQLEVYEKKISYLLKQLTDQLTDTWTAFQFVQTGQLFMKDQIDFVVIANYVLSSITYIANQPFSSMAFPFLQSQFPWFFGMTKTQASFQNAIWNGLYVCLFNMLEKRKTLAVNIQNEIVSISSQFYIYPTLIGISILIIFVLFSLVIQSKSSKIIQETSKLLSQIQIGIKKQRILKINQFNYIHNRIFSEKAIQTPNDKVQEISRQKAQIQQAFTHQENIITHQTQRQFRQMQSHKNQDSNLENNGQQFSSNGIQLSKKENIQTSETFQKFSFIQPLKKSKLKVILFYAITILPFIGYFTTIFIGGIYFNQKIMFYINFGSQLYHLNTHQEYIFLYSRQTFIFESGFDPNMQWGAMLIPQMLGVYNSTHYLQDRIDEIQANSKYLKLRQQLYQQNVCNYMDLISQKSIYYGIQFTKESCESIQHQVMTKGFKSAFISFVETGIQLLSRNNKPQLLKRQERIAYLQGDQLLGMKKILAYCEQFHKIMNEAFQKDIVELVDYYTTAVNVSSGILIFSLIFIILAINYRWKRMRNESKQVQSILRLVSFKEICNNKRLNEKFLSINYQFYE